MTTTKTISTTNLKSTPSTIGIILKSTVLTTTFLTLNETAITTEHVFQNTDVTRIVTTTNPISITTLETTHLYTYNEGQCIFDSDCNGELTCSTSEVSCACPLTVKNGFCDCPVRTDGRELYWNGTDCVFANTYGGSCNNSAYYMCQTLTLGLTCINNKCDCKDGLWSVIQRKCLNCMSNWILIGKTCYRVSQDPSESIEFDLLKTRPDIVVSMCYNEPTAKIARLNDANVNDIRNSDNFVLPYPKNNYDYLYVDNILDPGTDTFRSTDGLFELSRKYLQTVSSGSCLTIKNKVLLRHPCPHAHPILCEYNII